MITVPKIDEIRDQIISEIDSRLGTNTPLLPFSVVGVLATAIAGVVWLLYKMISWAYKQIVPQSADREQLIRIGEQFGLTPNPAVPAKLVIQISGDIGVSIPKATLWTDGEFVFEQLSDCYLSDVTVSTTVQSVNLGASGTKDVGSILKLVTPRVGVDRNAVVIDISQYGQDEESTESYRARLLQYLRARPQGGAVPDYVQWALEVPGVAEAYVDSPTPGTVRVYPIAVSDTPEERIPDSILIQQVQNYIADPQRKPLGASIEIQPPAEVIFDIDIADIAPANEETRSAVSIAIEEYLYSRRPAQYSNEPDPKNMVSTAEITAAAIAAGAKSCTVTMRISGGLDIPSYTLQIGELAKPGVINYV